MNKTQHSVYSLNYHIVFVVKYRKKVITQAIDKRLCEIFEYIGEQHGVKITEWNSDIDYVHILVEGSPSTNLNKFINAYKAASSRLIKKEFPDIQNELWESKFWSRGYFVSSTGGVTLDIVKQYVIRQGEK